MKFNIKYLSNCLNSTVNYIGDEFSFYTEPKIKEIDFSIVLNNLNLDVCNKQITQIWGYAGDVIWSNTNLNIPNYKEGILCIADDFEYGFSYRIYQNLVPVYHDIRSRWVCFGDPLIRLNGVKFMKNCVAIIDQNGKLISLWIRLLA